MALNVTSRMDDNFAVLELSGTLTLGPTLSQLREKARTIFSQNPNLSGMILLMREITVTDSSGLGEMMVVYTLSANRSCKIRLAEVPASLKRMLEMTRIDELLPSCATLAAAKADLKQKESGTRSAG